MGKHWVNPRTFSWLQRRLLRLHVEPGLRPGYVRLQVQQGGHSQPQDWHGLQEHDPRTRRIYGCHGNVEEFLGSRTKPRRIPEKQRVGRTLIMYDFISNK